MIERVNMGDKSALAMATEAFYKTAERFKGKCSKAAELIKRSSYVNDLIYSKPTLCPAFKRCQRNGMYA